MADETPTAASMKKIVILGGSFGGVSAAHYILKHVVPQMPDPASYQVVVVSTSSQAVWRPACPRALLSDDQFDQSKLFVSVPKILEQYPSCRFLAGTATALDHTARTVSVSVAAGGTEELDFHALIIATGASTPSPLFGLNHDADALRASWTEFRNALPTATSIVVVGGGPTGIETAGELGEHLNGRAGWRTAELANPKVRITLVTTGPQILPLLKPATAKSAEQYLAKVGVTVVKNAHVASVSPPGAGTTDVAAAATVTLEDGSTLETDLYIPATGLIPNTGFLSPALLTADTRIATDAATLRVPAAGPRVYAIGDAAASARPAVPHIAAAIPVLCANLKRDLLLAAGAEEGAVAPDRVFTEDMRVMQVVPVGRSKGVGAAMGYQLPSVMVWVVKGRDYLMWSAGDIWAGKQWTKEV